MRKSDHEFTYLQEKSLFTINEVSILANICRSLIYKEIKAGRLKIKKAGRRTLVARADLDAWCAAL